MKDTSQQEIELKYLILPENIRNFYEYIRKYQVKVNEIEQYYTEIKDDYEVRYRSVDDKVFFRTIKRGNGLVREERESHISREEYYTEKKRMFGTPIHKTRYKVILKMENFKYPFVVCEVDFYKRYFSGLCFAEFEFDNIDDAVLFGENVPEIFDLEVTENKRYKNKMLALNGRPSTVYYKDENSNVYGLDYEEYDFMNYLIGVEEDVPVAVNCRTLEDAKVFLKFAYEAGFDYNIYKEGNIENCWDIYKENTCYAVIYGQFLSKKEASQYYLAHKNREIELKTVIFDRNEFKLNGR